MEKKHRIVRAQGLFQLSPIFVDKKIKHALCDDVQGISLEDFKCVTGFRFIAPNKIDPII